MLLCGRLKVAHNVCMCLHSCDDIFDVHHNTHGTDATVLVCKCARMFMARNLSIRRSMLQHHTYSNTLLCYSACAQHVHIVKSVTFCKVKRTMHGVIQALT